MPSNFYIFLTVLFVSFLLHKCMNDVFYSFREARIVYLFARACCSARVINNIFLFECRRCMESCWRRTLSSPILSSSSRQTSVTGASGKVSIGYSHSRAYVLYELAHALTLTHARRIYAVSHTYWPTQKNNTY